MAETPDLVVVMSDTLRTAHVGCYGNTTIHTPSLDAFAARAMRFTRAYPESLPTIPVRRALHTGRRAYPFRDYRPVKWDIVYLPGWQAISNDEDTVAENLAAAGYQTGFATDTLPYFAPGFNFQRGFWQWEYLRGQQQDRWRSPFAVPVERLARYGNHLVAIDDRSHVLTSIDGRPQEIFDLEADPACLHDIAARDGGQRFKQAWDRLLADAGGELPDYRGRKQTDAIGQKARSKQ